MAAQKQRWFKIMAPSVFGEREVGETPSLDPKKLEGKTLRVNMFTLTDNMKRQNTEVNLLINTVEGDTAVTSVLGMRMLPTALRRMIRKGRTRLDQTLMGETKDGKVITIKLILVTRRVVQGAVFTSIQNEVTRYVLKAISASTYDELTSVMIEGRLQKDLKNKLAKVYPLRSCDVREFKLERNLKAAELRRIKALQDNQKDEPVQEEEYVEEEPVEAQAA